MNLDELSFTYQKGLHNPRIEVGAFAIDNDIAGPVMCKGLFIRAFGHEGIVNVCEGEDPWRTGESCLL